MSKRRPKMEEELEPEIRNKALPLFIAVTIIIAGIGAAAYLALSPHSQSGSINIESGGSSGGSGTGGGENTGEENSGNDEGNQSGSTTDTNQTENGGDNTGSTGNTSNNQTESSNPLAIMHVRSDDGSIDGIVKIELYMDKAPITVRNFINYSDDGFYKGLVFHRVIPDFVAQGGGFYYGNDGVLTYKQPIYSPIKSEANNGLSNVKGTIAMARTSDPNSATSQFYFNLKDNPSLDYSANNPGYCVFGKVISGWDLVQAMANIPTHKETAHFPQGDTELSDVPTVHITIVSVTIQNA